MSRGVQQLWFWVPGTPGPKERPRVVGVDGAPRAGPGLVEGSVRRRNLRHRAHEWLGGLRTLEQLIAATLDEARSPQSRDGIRCVLLRLPGGRSAYVAELLRRCPPTARDAR